MKKLNLVVLFLLFSLNSFSQISFEKGYFINNSDERIECLIKNVDWKNNPTSFEYRLSDVGSTKISNIKNVKEFAIQGSSKFIRSNVKIDKSSNLVNNLSKVRQPIFVNEQLFLKVLIEGDLNLYQYVSDDLKRFFFNKREKGIEQLIYKRYVVVNNNFNESNNIKINNRFRQQILKLTKCSDIYLEEVKRMKYKKSDLIKYFSKLNECNNSEFISFEKSIKKDLFNLSIRPRINNSSLNINPLNSESKSIGNTINFGLGVELEYIFPFNKNKWSVLVEPTYQSFNSNKEVNRFFSNPTSTKLNVSTNYNSIELHIGIRHYLFLNNNNNKLFANISLVIDKNLGSSSIKFSESNELDIKSNPSLSIGIGYKAYDRFSLELRHVLNRSLTGEYVVYGSSFRMFSLIFGYSVF